jgi:hypothetical protein
MTTFISTLLDITEPQMICAFAVFVTCNVIISTLCTPIFHTEFSSRRVLDPLNDLYSAYSVRCECVCGCRHVCVCVCVCGGGGVADATSQRIILKTNPNFELIFLLKREENKTFLPSGI